MHMGEFEIMLPEIDPISFNEAYPGDVITITGRFFGRTRKAAKLVVAYIYGHGLINKTAGCPIIKDSLWMDPKTGESGLQFVVPDVRPVTKPEVGTLIIQNKIGGAIIGACWDDGGVETCSDEFYVKKPPPPIPPP